MAEETNGLTDKVMREISRRRLKMRPRIYFVAGSVLIGLGLAGMVLAAIFFLNLVVFHLRVAHPFGFLAFGARGIEPFLVTFPFVFLGLALGSFWGGLRLVRKFDFTYKKGLALTGVVMAVLVVSLSTVLDRVEFYEKVRQTRTLQPLFRQRAVSDEWVIGEVVRVEAEKEEAVVETPAGEQVRVQWDEETDLPPGKAIQSGEQIKAVGEYGQQEQNFEAEAIGRNGSGAKKQQGPGR